MAEWAIGERAAKLHREALVWDNHSCFPHSGAEPLMPQLERYRQSGVDVLGVNIGDSNIELAEMIRLAAALRDFVARNADRFVLARNVADIATAKAQGKLAIILDIEGCYAMGDQLSLIPFFFDIGVRWMLMVYNTRNLVGSGVHDAVDEGLTPFGRKAIAEMDRVGLIKCCSHTGYRTAMDVLTASSKPCIFSHSNPRALRDHPRNIPDELIKACAQGGGVVCINGLGIFLGDNDIRTGTIVRHIDYVEQLVGAAHIGLGLDYVFDQAGMDKNLAKSNSIWPEGFGYKPGIKFVPPEQLPELTEALLNRGYSETDIGGILGGNMMRVARAVWPA
jgi:membrane dipeptidase